MEVKEVSRLFEFIHYQNSKYPQQVAFADKVDGKWNKYSTQEIIDLADQFSAGLIKLGIQPGDKVAMISNNRSEWTCADIGLMQLGVISVPVYPTIAADDFAYIFNHAEVKMVIVSDQELLDKVNSIKNDVPNLKHIYTFNDISGTPNWKEINNLGKENPIDLDQYRAAVKTDALATLIYTSGTTGRPKGVMLSHANLVSNVLGSKPRVPVDNRHTALSFLPVCHVYERMLLYLYQYIGISVYYAESMETIGDDLKEVKPHVFTAVPRLLEKVYDKIVAKGEELTGIKKRLFFWALKLGQEYDVIGKSGFYHFKLKIARKLIFSKWQAALGGNCMAAVSGSAALQARLTRVYLAAGIPIYEGYGLTETSPVISVNCEMNDGIRIGTVGRVLEDVTVKIADDGEILVKGPNVMMGYYKQADLTAEVMDADGWFHTGDIGEFIEGEYLKITDRKKEIFKTSGGKYIAPQPMENKFKESRFIEQVMVVGENQKHASALIVPAFDFIQEWAKRKGFEIKTRQEMVDNEAVKARIMEDVNELNQSFGKWEQVKKIELCPTEWSVETEELTPTLKLRRKIILKKYENEFNRLYNL